MKRRVGFRACRKGAGAIATGTFRPWGWANSFIALLESKWTFRSCKLLLRPVLELVAGQLREVGNVGIVTRSQRFGLVASKRIGSHGIDRELASIPVPIVPYLRAR
jgi:hypothetical protein